MFRICFSACWNNNFVEDSVDEVIIFILLVDPVAVQFELYEGKKCREMFVSGSLVFFMMHYFVFHS